ncbi:twin-arginine translocase subunit TatC [Bacillus sp. JJ1773]|uniref:twin-arginine translocase subunit TatC n=1 Tax=Bacillus sp. JJ1773 TaxID=3122965 RepID=UPI003000645C
MDKMSSIEHLTELRKRLISVLVVLIIAAGIGFSYSGVIIKYLQQQVPSYIELNVFSPSTAMVLYMKVAFLFGFILTLPFLIYQIWKFVSPALHSIEKKLVLRYIPIAPLLMVVGLLFGYYWVFPLMLHFMSVFSAKLGVTEVYGINEYFQNMFNIVVPFGVLFELPLMVVILTHLRILNPYRLKKMRKFAYFGFCVISITITPPDFISDIMICVPLIALYEISYLLSKLVYRKQMNAEALAEA